MLHYHCLQSTHSRAQLSQSHTVTENIFSKNLNQAFPRNLIVKKRQAGQMVEEKYGNQQALTDAPKGYAYSLCPPGHMAL